MPAGNFRSLCSTRGAAGVTGLSSAIGLSVTLEPLDTGFGADAVLPVEEERGG